MKKSVSIMSIIVGVCLLFSSCGSSRMLKPVNELFTPPLYYTEFEDLVKCFKKDVGSDATLCIPYGGEHRSAITVEDIDNDDIEEAIIFYKSSSDDSVPRVHIFDKVGDEWKSMSDIGGYGSGVDKIMISDLDSDGIDELVVSWSSSGASGSILSILYSQNANSEFKEIVNEFCYISEILDMDSDGINELFFISQNSVSGVPQRLAKLIKISGGEVIILDEANTDSHISGYSTIKTEKLTEDSPLKVYVDAFRGDNQMITELIFWDSEKAELSVPFFDEKTMSNNETVRNEAIECRDVNNDGSIEIPIQSENEIAVQRIDIENIPLTKWIDYIDGETVTVMNSFVNSADGYMIKIDVGNEENITARSYSSENVWVISDSEEDICLIRIVDYDEWQRENFNNYVEVFVDNDRVVCAYITQKGEDLGLTPEIVKDNTIKF